MFSLHSLLLLLLFLAADCVLELAESLLSEDGFVLDDVVVGVFVLVHLDLEGELLCQFKGDFDLGLLLQLRC